MGNSNQHELERDADRFCYEHKEDLRQILKEAYARYTLSGIYDDEIRSRILSDSDFPAMVGFPLLLLFMATGLCVRTFRNSVADYIFAALFIVFGFVIRIYAKYVISLTSWRLFRLHQYHIVVEKYINELRDEALIQADTLSEMNSLNEFYDLCIKKFVSSHYFDCLHEVKNRKLDKEAKKRK